MNSKTLIAAFLLVVFTAGCVLLPPEKPPWEGQLTGTAAGNVDCSAGTTLLDTAGEFPDIKTSVKIANYSYLTKDKLGVALVTDTVKNKVDAKNYLLDCPDIVCDYRIEIDAKQAQTHDANMLTGAYTGEGVSIQKIFILEENITTSRVCNNITDNITVKEKMVCQDITTATYNENTNLTKPFIKDEVRTYVIRFVKDNTINANGQKKYNNQVVDIYHKIFGQERKDAALWNSTGGSVTYDGNYTVVTFLANGTFNVTGNITNATVLVVAGGGGSGKNGGGGGGAGGLIYNTSYNATGNITVAVGIGGTAEVKGQNSSFGTLNADGGGRGGGSVVSWAGGNGGSGGGAGTVAETSYGNGTSGQGYNGGQGYETTSQYYEAGGGGGSGSVGADAVAAGHQAGNGGNGTNYSINGSSVCYAGGGGGGGYSGYGDVPGNGTCGGGNGTSAGRQAGKPGINGTGGGAGGGAGNNGLGATGGSGIVIIRYLTYVLEGNLTVNATTGGSASGNNSSFTPPANLTINATASAGYYFTNWTITTGNCTLLNASNAITNVSVLNTSNCNAQANFANASPIIQSSTILPSPAYTNASLQLWCNATTGNAANVTYNYTTYKNGVVNTTGIFPSSGNITQGINTNVANISNTSLVVGQNWTLQCSAYNANGASSALNSSVTKIVAVPVIQSSTILPSPAYTNASLIGWCNATTADGGNVTYNYTWYLNGAALAQAVGGTKTTILDGGVNYTIHTFTNNSSFDVNGTLTGVSLLIIAGGAAGGCTGAGGGGAGGLIYQNANYTATGNNTIVVGVGGVAVNNCGFAVNGENGKNTTAFGFTAIGGGGGGTWELVAGSGGSGGGAGRPSTAKKGNGTAGQGYDGGSYESDVNGGSGGGGAGSIGMNASDGANGGIGINYTINGSTVCYAGGGGGCGYTVHPNGNGTCGGGNGASSQSVPGISGTNGTGGGGGGTWQTSISGSGGSGIVIVRYLTANSGGVISTVTQGINTNVANISSASLAVGQNWTLQCSAYNSNGVSSFLNSSVTTIQALPVASTQVLIRNSTGSYVSFNFSGGQMNFRCSNPFPSYCQPQNQNNVTGIPILVVVNNGTGASTYRQIKTNETWSSGDWAVLMASNETYPTLNVSTTLQNYSTASVAAGANQSLYMWLYVKEVPANFPRTFNLTIENK